jgi:transketolase
MRKKFIEVVTELFKEDDKTILVLGDIGVYGFAPLAKEYPDRIINIGICEQATIGIIAGMAKEGLHPIFYTIAPFAVERCFEQIKIDIGYQNLPVTIVSVGGSYDYPALGCTHHCPGDVALLKTIPNMEIAVIGYKNMITPVMGCFHGLRPVYIRLSERPCFLKSVFEKGNKNLIIAIGDTADRTIKASESLDVSILTPTILSNMFLPHHNYAKIAIIEPFYEGTMLYDIARKFPRARILSIGVPQKFITTYGTIEDHDKECGLDVDSLKTKLTKFFNG